MSATASREQWLARHRRRSGPGGRRAAPRLVLAIAAAWMISGCAHVATWSRADVCTEPCNREEIACEARRGEAGDRTGTPDREQCEEAFARCLDACGPQAAGEALPLGPASTPGAEPPRSANWVEAAILVLGGRR